MTCLTAAPPVWEGTSIAAAIAERCASPTIHAAIATAPPASIYRVNAGLEQRKGELLPTDYFHVVFTLPHDAQSYCAEQQDGDAHHPV